jgi:hypothetical protein
MQPAHTIWGVQCHPVECDVGACLACGQRRRLQLLHNCSIQNTQPHVGAQVAWAFNRRQGHCYRLCRKCVIVHSSCWILFSMTQEVMASNPTQAHTCQPLKHLPGPDARAKPSMCVEDTLRLNSSRCSTSSSLRAPTCMKEGERGEYSQDRSLPMDDQGQGNSVGEGDKLGSTCTMNGLS